MADHPVGGDGTVVVVDVGRAFGPDRALSFDVGVEIGEAFGSAATISDPEGGAGFEVKIVDKYGTVLQALTNTTGHTVTKTLNLDPIVAFSSPKYDPATAHVELLKTEVQVFRDSDLKAWAVVLTDQGQSDSGNIGFTASGLFWYFRRRYFGTAQRSNKIANGDFESGPAAGIFGRPIPSWRQVGPSSFAQYTHATKPNPALPDPLTGTKAVATFGASGANSYLSSTWGFRTEHPPGQLVSVAAWVYLADFAGGAAFNLGIYVARIVGGLLTRNAYVTVDASTAVGQWVRLDTSLTVPPHEDGIVETRLYAPGGLAVWDAAVSALMESTSSAFAGTDQTVLAGQVVAYGQNGRGKSPLNIGIATPPSGVLRQQSWQHVEHQWLSDAVDGLATFPNGFDHRVEVTPRTRTFRTFFPRAGVDRRGTTTLTFRENVAHYSRPRDGSQVSTSVIASSTNQGPTREEGSARNADAVDGLILEERFDAPAGTTIGDLDGVAEAELDAVDAVIDVIELTLVDRTLIDLLEEPGDLVRVVIDDGYEQVDGDYRIVKTVLTAPSLVVTVNPWVD